MSVIIRRERPRRDRPGGRWLALTLAAGVICAGVAGLGMAWRAGGPQPLHEISMPVKLPGGVAS